MNQHLQQARTTHRGTWHRVAMIALMAHSAACADLPDNDVALASAPAALDLGTAAVYGLLDTNNDGIDELISYYGTETHPYSRIFANQVDASFTPVDRRYHAAQFSSKQDFDGSGHPAYCERFVYEHHIKCSRDAFGTLPWISQDLPGSIAHIADFTGDGRDDLLVKVSRYPDITYVVYTYNGRDAFEPVPNFDTRALDAYSYRLTVGDWNGDGMADFIADSDRDHPVRYTMVTRRLDNGYALEIRDTLFDPDTSMESIAARITNDRADDLLFFNHETGALEVAQWDSSNRWQRLPPPAGLTLPPRSAVYAGRFNTLAANAPNQRHDLLVISEPHMREFNRVPISHVTRFDAVGPSDYRMAFANPSPDHAARWHLPTPQRVLMLKCRYRNDSTVPHPHSYYERLLHQGLVPFFHDNTMGTFDLSGSYVDPAWHTIRLRYNPGREGLADACRRAYGRPTSDYARVIFLYNREGGDSGRIGDYIVETSPHPTQPRLAMLLGSSFGWAVSRDDSRRQVGTWAQPGEYYHAWDIMSTMNTLTTPGPGDMGPMGPGLSAPERLRQQYIPAERVRTLARAAAAQPGGTYPREPTRAPEVHQVEVAALDQPHAYAPMVIRVGDDDAHYYTIEYRERQGWDAGFSSNVVLVHEIRAGVARLVTSYGGAERTPGETTYLLLASGMVTLEVAPLTPLPARLT